MESESESDVHNRLFKPIFDVNALKLPICKMIKHKCWVCDEMTVLDNLTFRENTRIVNGEITNLIIGKDPNNKNNYANHIEICSNCLKKEGGIGSIRFNTTS
jgi:5-methylcytosine-specific restriction endonuclease McrA